MKKEIDMLKPIIGTKFNTNYEITNNILKALHLHTDGYCPCVSTVARNENTICPCKEYKETKECKCGLFVKDTD